MQNKSFNKIVNILYNEEIENINGEELNNLKQGTVKIQPRILYDKFSGNMKMEFKIGKNRMYKIKNLSEFYSKMLSG